MWTVRLERVAAGCGRFRKAFFIGAAIHSEWLSHRNSHPLGIASDNPPKGPFPMGPGPGAAALRAAGQTKHGATSWRCDSAALRLSSTLGARRLCRNAGENDFSACLHFSIFFLKAENHVWRRQLHTLRGFRPSKTSHFSIDFP